MNEKNGKTKLGKILLKQKLVNAADLEELLVEQKQGNKKRLASQALEKGLVEENKLLKALSEQHGVPATNLDEVEIQLKNLDVIPQDIARKHLILPISVTSDSIHLAMANPDDERVIDEIEFVCGKRVYPHVALQVHIVDTIDQCYFARSSGKETYKGKQVQKPVVQPVDRDPDDDENIVISLEEMPPLAGTVIADSPAIPEEAKMDLRIDMESDVDQLSTLEPMSPIEIDLDEVSTNAGKLKILVVDDEEDILLLISKVLEDKGYDVVTALRGLEAIKKVQTEGPDMIILDAMLPEVHGFDICKKIKGSSKYGHIPVIMISAIYRGWRYAKDLKDSYGVDDFIEKPFKINELIEKVEKHSPANTQGQLSRAKELSKEAERTLAVGIEAYRNGNIEDAIDLLKKGIKIDPLAYKLQYHLALLLGKKGLNYQAIRALENTLELAPDYFPALKNLAVLYQKAGFKFKAVETWERALGHCDEEKTREGIKRHLVSLL
jgi:DNA-binding response OmpR family regulator